MTYPHSIWQCGQGGYGRIACWMLEAGGMMLVTGCRMLEAGGMMLVTGCRMLVDFGQLLKFSI